MADDVGGLSLKLPNPRLRQLPFVVVGAIARRITRFVSAATVEAQVRRVIVGFDTVHMVDQLVAAKRPSKNARHNEPVFKDEETTPPHGMPQVLPRIGHGFEADADVSLARVDPASGAQNGPFSDARVRRARQTQAREPSTPDFRGRGAGVAVSLSSTARTRHADPDESLISASDKLQVGPINSGMRQARPSIRPRLMDKTVAVAAAGEGATLDAITDGWRVFLARLFAPRARYLDEQPIPTTFDLSPIDCRVDGFAHVWRITYLGR